MSGLFDFLTVSNLLIFLLCVIGLYYSINLVIYYYAPTATPFVNMYFLYYIFFIITLLISVACNNYIEMNDSDIDVSDMSNLIPPTSEITNGINKIAEVGQGAEGVQGAEVGQGVQGTEVGQGVQGADAAPEPG